MSVIPHATAWRRYEGLVDENGLCTIPRSECMKDVSKRVVGYWEEEIVPAVKSGKRVLVTVRRDQGVARRVCHGLGFLFPTTAVLRFDL